MSDPTAKEVRLGLVCYGGVSLAIYMHGLTKEIFKLVRAARAFDRARQDGAQGDLDPHKYLSQDAVAGATADYDSEPAYFAALAALANAGQPLTVTVDVIAGTSAGGINGVCLARALAGGRSLDKFRELWLDNGDMGVLLAGHALFPWGKGKLVTQFLDSVAHVERHPKEGLLNGDLMCRLLYQALGGMEQVEAPLIAPDESLDLFVTATSVHGYQTVIPTGAGGVSHTDTSYRQLMRFSYQQEPPPMAARFAADFSEVPALTFAARATASFPGAFPPVSMTSMFNAIGQARGARSPAGDADYEQIARHFVYGSGNVETPAEQWFMDGGVLDNGPFDHVIDAIAAKRADGPTAREIIYLEPDPGAPAAHQPGDHPPSDDPTFAKTILASRVTIPWNTSMASVLGELEEMNATIAEVGDLVGTLQPAVLQQLETAQPVADALNGEAAYDGVLRSSDQVRAAARQLAGELGYGTYCRLRVQALAESFGLTVAADLGFPSASNRTSFVVAVLCAWARQQHSWKTADTQTLEDQLAPVDVPFRLRRAEFVLQGINEQFGAPGSGSHAELVAMKRACWDLLVELRAKQQAVASLVHDQALALFGPQALSGAADLANPDSFARARTQELGRLYQACVQSVTKTGVTGTSQDLWTALAMSTRGWEHDQRSALLARYVGFPIWDSLIFPVISLSRLPQLTPITVHRFSPVDATCLRAVNSDGSPKAGTPWAKLDGVKYGHFGAFFEKDWRENDYLWGRLDGAELVLRLLSRQSGSDLDLTEHLRSALTAVLDAEQPQLTEIRPVWRALKDQVTGMPAGSMGPGGVTGG
jgi:patatin-related protein